MNHDSPFTGKSIAVTGKLDKTILVLGEAEIIECIGDNLYLAEVNGVRCTAIFNPFVSRYFVDDLYGIVDAEKYAD